MILSIRAVSATNFLIISFLTISRISIILVRGQTLAEKWQIQDPVYTWTASENKIEFDYVVSTFITESNPKVEIFDNDCKEGGNIKSNGFTTSLTGLEGTTVDVSSETFSVAGRASYLDVILDLQQLSNDPDLFTDNTDIDNTAKIEFCVRYSLEATDGVEVNFVENIFSMQINLRAGFTVEAFDLRAKDKAIITSTESYNVEAKLCVGTGPSSESKKVDPPFGTIYNQGELITVCVYPNDKAIDDGIVMNSIDSYSWKRQDPDIDGITPPEIKQHAIVGGIADTDTGLSTFNNCNSEEVCVFDSILFAQFYINEGTISGEGIATLQFGDRRGLGNTNDNDGNVERRWLQAIEGQAAEFSLNVDVNRLDDFYPGLLANATSSNAGSVDVNHLDDFLSGLFSKANSSNAGSVDVNRLDDFFPGLLSISSNGGSIITIIEGVMTTMIKIARFVSIMLFLVVLTGTVLFRGRLASSAVDRLLK